MTSLDNTLKSRAITLLKDASSLSYGFSSSHVQMWDLDHKEGWALTNWCFKIVMLEKTLESPLDCKIKPVNPTGYQPWIFIERTAAEAPILWPPHGTVDSLGKSLIMGKIEGKSSRGVAEDDVVTWHHWLNGHEFELTLGDSGGKKSWCAAVYGVAKSQMWLTDYTITRFLKNYQWRESILKIL